MGSSSFSSALSTILPCFNTKYFPQFDPFHLQLPLTDSLFIILSESHFHVSTFDKIVQTVFLGEPSVRRVDSKSGYPVFGWQNRAEYAFVSSRRLGLFVHQPAIREVSASVIHPEM